MKKAIIFMAVVALAAASFGAINVGNPSFDEDLQPGDPETYSYNWSPWKTSDWSWLGNGYYAGAPAGDGWYVITAGATWFQDMSDTFIPGQTIDFSIDIGTYTGDTADNWTIFLYDATVDPGEDWANDTNPNAAAPTSILATVSGLLSDEVTPTGVWYNKTVSYTANTAEDGHAIGIGFVGDYYTLLDHASVAVNPIPKAWEPDPEDDQPGVVLDQVLSWNAGIDPNTGLVNPAITDHELYMSNGTDDDPNLYFVKTIPIGDDAQYTPGGEWLSRDATYYWRVDEVTDANTITGSVWEFEALLSIPMIDEATPANALVDPNENVVFTVSAVNPFTYDSSGLSYEWHRVGVVEPVGTNSPTLTITEAKIANEGEYYCTVTIVSNSAIADSRSASLVIKRRLGHWKLDETSGTTAADSSDSSNTGTVFGAGTSPAWTTGIDNGALSFDGVDYDVVGSLLTDYVDCGSDDSLKPAKQLTVAGWYNTDTYTYYGQIAGIAFDEVSNESGYSIITEDGTDADDGVDLIGFWLVGDGGSGTYLFTSDIPAVPTGWTHVAGTYDGATMRLYINGVEKATSTAQSGNIDYDHVNSFRIGLNESGAWWLPYQGDIDDVRVYSYALDPVEIAQIFVTTKPGEKICLEYPTMDLTGPDGVPDCRVDIIDLKEMAASWLQCNSIPVDSCPVGLSDE